MSVGGVLLLVSTAIFICLGMGIVAVPRFEYLAFACLALGILLSGIPLRWPVA